MNGHEYSIYKCNYYFITGLQKSQKIEVIKGHHQFLFHQQSSITSIILRNGKHPYLTLFYQRYQFYLVPRCYTHLYHPTVHAINQKRKSKEKGKSQPTRTFNKDPSYTPHLTPLPSPLPLSTP